MAATGRPTTAAKLTHGLSLPPADHRQKTAFLRPCCNRCRARRDASPLGNEGATHCRPTAITWRWRWGWLMRWPASEGWASVMAWGPSHPRAPPSSVVSAWFRNRQGHTTGGRRIAAKGHSRGILRSGYGRQEASAPNRPSGRQRHSKSKNRHGTHGARPFFLPLPQSDVNQTSIRVQRAVPGFWFAVPGSRQVRRPSASNALPWSLRA